MVHACDVGDRCVVESGAVILDGSTVAAGSVIAEGSVVFPRSNLEGGWRYAGTPAKPVEKLTPDQLDECHRNIRSEEPAVVTAPTTAETVLDSFVAPSAHVTGAIEAGTDVGIWYGCHLDAGSYRIAIGCLLYTSPSPRDRTRSRMPSSA